MNTFYRTLIIFFLVIIKFHLTAQYAPVTNIQAIDVNSLSEEQFNQLISRLQLSGLTEEELEQKALEKGLTPLQINDIRSRYNKNRKPEKTVAYEDFQRAQHNVEKPDKVVDSEMVFGKELFSKSGFSFEPNLRIPTPRNYVLGVDDEIIVEIFGFSEKSYKLKVNNEGQIRIPLIGPIRVSGLTIDEVKQKLKILLSKIYPNLKNGTTSIQVSLGPIRSIRVLMIGEAIRPGVYSLSSLSTIANALFVSGGPNNSGTLRKIDLIRNGKTIVTFDLYDFLLKGDLSKNLLLEDDDIIKINPFLNRVHIKGQVKRPGIYECFNNTTLDYLIDSLASGFLDKAYRKHFTVKRISDSGIVVKNVSYDSLSRFVVHSSDIVEISEIANRYSNSVEIEGSVYYPGYYSLEQYSSLLKLIQVSIPKENTYLRRVSIKRKVDDKDYEMINLDLMDIIEGKKDFILKDYDLVRLYSKSDLREAYSVVINGEVNKPGVYQYLNGLTLKDIIFTAGGFKDNASLNQVQISRRIRKDTTLADTTVFTLIKDFNLTDSLVSSALDYPLEPFDIILIKNQPRNKFAGTITIKGQVLFPGQYVISSAQDRVSTIINRAGGLLNQGDIKSALLLRPTFSNSQDNSIKYIKRELIAKQLSDSVSKSKIDSLFFSSQKIVSVDLGKAILNPGSQEDIILQDGDFIDIPIRNPTVQVFGAVQLPKKLIYKHGLTVRKVLDESGGVLEDASTKKLFVVYPNGHIKSTRNIFGFKLYPRLTEGAEVYVPNRKKSKPLSTAELLAISSSLTGMTAMIFAILNFTK